MKNNYLSRAFLPVLLMLCLYSNRGNAQAYWTQQYNSLPVLYDVTGILGYGPNILLGGKPYYTHTYSTAFQASPSVHKIYRFIKAYGMLVGVGDSALFTSSDDGVTWDSTNMSYPVYHISSDARISVDGDTLYAWDPNNMGFGNDVLKSSDTGKTWISSGYQQPDGYAFLVHNGVAYASYLAGLQYSTDQGSNWQYVTTIGTTINDIKLFNDTVYAATSMGVYKNMGSPQTWTGTLMYNALSLCDAGATLLCGTQENGFWQSDPTGIYWFSKSDDLPYTGSGVLKPLSEVGYNDYYVLANVRFDTTGVVHYLYTMPIIALSTGNVPTLTDVQVYPSPAKGVLYINTGNALNGKVKVSLMDIQGRILRKEQYSDMQVLPLQLDNIPPGMYIVNIDDGHSSTSRKVSIFD